MVLRLKSDPVACALLISSVALVAEAYYPGYLNWDSVWQLRQARSGDYTDWHPPILSYLWGLMDRVWPGTGAILVIDLVCLTVGMFLTLRCFFRPLPAAILAALILVLPPVLGVAGMIAKDATLIGLFTLAVGLTLTAETARLRKWAKGTLLATAAAALLFAQLCRYNALPLTGLAGYAVIRTGLHVFGRLPADRRPVLVQAMLLCTSFSVFAAVMLAVPLINRNLLNAKHQFAFQHIIIYDVSAISIRTGTLLLGPEVFPAQNLDTLVQMFTGESAISVLHPPDELSITDPVRETENPADVEALTRQWIKAIADHPLPYLAIRFDLFYRLIGLPGHRVCTPFFGFPDNQYIGLDFPNKDLNGLLHGYLVFFENSLLNRAWIYILLGSANVVFLFRKPGVKGNRTLAVMGMAPLLYIAPYFFIAPSCEFRYVAPVVVSGLLVTAAAVRQWDRRLARPG